MPNSKSTCVGSTINVTPTITAGYGIISAQWLPTTGVSSPTTTATNIIAPSSATTYTLTVKAQKASLVYNGDFSLGETGYTTGYGLGTGGTWGPISTNSTYSVVANSHDAHTNFTPFYDHTTGVLAGSAMACFNGSSIPNTMVWCQTISVVPNTVYTFSFWAAPCVAGSPAQLQPIINGVYTGVALTLSNVPGTWLQYTATWNSGASTTASICIADLNLAGPGNDFALDDINLSEVCTTNDTIAINPHPLNLFINATKHLGCVKDTIKFTGTDNIASNVNTYTWNFGDGGTSTQNPKSHIYNSQGNYNITLIGNNGFCKDTVTTTINTFHPIQAVITALDTICSTSPLIVSASNSQTNASINKLNWNFGDGTNTITNNTNTSTQHTYTNGGNYTVTLTVTDTLGCTNTATKKEVIDIPYNQFTFDKIPACVNEAIVFLDTLSSSVQSFIFDNGNGKIYNNIHHPETYYSQSGDYIVTLTATYKVCPTQTFSQVLHVDKYPYLTLSDTIEICPTLDKITIGDYNNPNATYLWSTGETTNAIQITSPDLYTVEASFGRCKSTAHVLALGNTDCINQPNAFSPNGDGNNDYFKPIFFNTDQITFYTFNIYNRWGNLVFNSTNKYEEGWNGNYNGKKADADTYYYITTIELLDGHKKTYKGDVILIR